MKKPRSSGVSSDSNSLSSQNDEFREPQPPSSPLSLPDAHRFEEVEIQNDEALEDEEEDNEGGGEEDDYDDDVEEEYEGEEEDEERESEGVEVVGDEAGVTAATTTEQFVKRQKLADGFYEVEAIRKKRICKGVPQYLIKWRDWPESANTWEPASHLQTCPDVIVAYESSLQSGQKKSSRKRKRKFTQPKKKMQYSYGVSKSKITPVKMLLSSEPQDFASLENSKHVHREPGMVDVVVEHVEAMKTSRSTKKVDCNGCETMSPHVASSDRDHAAQLSGQNTSRRSLDEPSQQPRHAEEDGPANCQPKVDCVDAGQSNQRRGAKRRKSGSVRRFTQDISSFNVDCFGTPLPANISPCDGVEQLMIGSSDAYRKKKSDSSKNSAVITRLIKPIRYSASVINNVQDVTVTFVAMRSDGKEVMVDNKFLKATNPLLLINFYEQHLRYNPN